MKKAIIPVLMAVALCFANVAFLSKSSYTKAETSVSKNIDMYLIGGQSNAAGYTTVSGLKEEEKNVKFNNVMYAGQTDKYITGGVGQNWLEYENFKKYVSAGYGTNIACMGPEYGMAKVLNNAYTSENKAFIFKTAAGGTCLQDEPAVYRGSYGNWYPRSLWSEGYEPDLNNTVLNETYTGYLYKLFVENFKKVYTQLKQNGYNPVVKGMVWMQGEQDVGLGCTGAGKDYAVLLKQFITDIRNDIYSVTGDEKTIDMRFVIGKIATTFATPDNPGVPVINALQDKVARDMDYVETIETSDLIITKYDANGKIVNVGTDQYHFNSKDDITLGERFAEKLLSMEESTDGKVKLTCANGTADVIYQNNQIIISDIKADSGYKLSSVIVNDKKYYYKGQSGYPVTSYQNNQMTLDVSELNNPIRYLVSIYFEEDARVLKIVNDSSKGRVITTPNALKQKIGTRVTVDIRPYTGYEVDTVKFNDKVITASENGKYQIIYGEENKLEILYKNARENENGPTKEQTTGCNGTINGLPLFAALAIIPIIKLKKKV